jgi:hypothetical protein
MEIPGSFHLKRLLAGKNVVVMAGPFVIKRVGHPNQRRKFHSETIGRELLSRVGIATVPIRAAFKLLDAFVMERSPVPTLNRMLTEKLVSAFGQHVIELATRRLPLNAPSGYYWLDAPNRIRAYPGYADFLAEEFAAEEAIFAAAYPSHNLHDIRACLRNAERQPDRLLVLTDVAPKNVVYHDGQFMHLDLEVTLAGPPEFLLVKAAVNLASDVGSQLGARRVRVELLQQCGSLANARAALVFALLRRMVYEARAKTSDSRAGAALQATLAGEPLANAITYLEGSWDVGGDPP